MVKKQILIVDGDITHSERLKRNLENEKYNVDPSKAAGRILSIYDSGDEKFESCDGTIKASTNVKFEETDLDSGKGHKVFRIPKEKFIEQWRDPLIEWVNG